MFFCPNCNNLFNITNLAKHNKQLEGGKVVNYDELIKKILSKETIDDSQIEGLSIENLLKQETYNSLKPTHREYVYNKVMDLTKIQENKLKNTEMKEHHDEVYFICNNCGTTKKVKENTLIFSKVSNDISQSYVASDLADMQHSDILPITRIYICPNTECESHKNLAKREAKFFRLNNSFRLKYICLACNTSFDPA
jgi:ribosomal protein S27AE